jgi:hypothetical protein
VEPRVEPPDWDVYAKQLQEILSTPLTAPELIAKACEHFGWGPWFTRNVIAFADTRYLWYSQKKWSLQRPCEKGTLTDDAYKRSTKQGAIKYKRKVAVESEG